MNNIKINFDNVKLACASCQKRKLWIGSLKFCLEKSVHYCWSCDKTFNIPQSIDNGSLVWVNKETLELS